MNLAAWREARTALRSALEYSIYETNAVLAKSLINIVDGEEALGRGELAPAIIYFDEAVRLTPGEVNTYVARGRAKAQKGDWRGALADYDQTIQFKPEHPQAYARRGAAKLALGDLDGAQLDLDKAISLDAKVFEPYYDRGRLRTKAGDFKGAKADFEKALTLAVDAAPLIASQFAKLGGLQSDSDQFGDALESFTAALKTGLESESATYVRFAIWVLRARGGEQQSATSELKAYLDARPAKERNEWTSSIGDFLLGLLPEGALIQTAHRGDEKQLRERKCEAFYYVGIARLLQGDQQTAMTNFERCVETQVKHFAEYSGSVAELRRLRAK